MRRQRALGLFVVLAGLAPIFFFSTVQGAAASNASRGPSPAPKSMTAAAEGVRATPTVGNFAGAVNHLGLTKYASLYAGDILNPGGSVTILLGPGSATSFRASLSALRAKPAVKALGPEPSVRIERVPQSIGVLDASSRTVSNHFAKLMAAGYKLATWMPDLRKGTVDVTLSAAPRGMSRSDVTRYFRRTLSSHLVVTSVSAPALHLFVDRQEDAVPFFGGDLIYNPNVGWCTSGFTVIGTAGYPRAMTDGHCGDGTFTNGGWYVGPNGGQPTATSGTVRTFGTTSNYHYGSNDDVQLVENPNEEGFNPYVWVGTGTNQPTAMAVTAPFTDFPAVGQQLTTDGAFTRTVRYVPVLADGSTDCGTFDGVKVCNLIELAGTSAQGVSPTAQPGDSGGPVFCYACSSAGVTPAGLIEGGTTAGQPVYATEIEADLKITGASMEESP